MENYNGLGFRQFEETDVQLLIPIMKRAFDKDAQIHLGTDDGPDGYDNGDFLKKWYLTNKKGAFVVYKDNIPIGGLNVFVNIQKREGFLGNMFIDSDYENKGIGVICWKFIEQKFSQIKIWKTETPKFSTRNHHFYVNKCGFKIWKIENPKEVNKGQYLLEKIM
jgi:predicted acetyltransferase